jgi:taurine dioxygenase
MSYRLEPVAATFGAIVYDLDLANGISSGTARRLADDLHARRLLIIPGQRLDHVAHIRISKIFGQLDANAHVQFAVPGHPEILVISNIFEDGRPIGLYDGDNEEEWHADHSWRPQLSSASLLYCQIAAERGGETRFADTTAAYEELPERIRCRIGDLKTIHSLADLTAAQNAANNGVSVLQPHQVRPFPDAVHPLVLQHPVTARQSLLLGSMIISGIVGLADADARELLGELHRHATTDRYVYSHRWSVGDLVIWDNWAAMHTASPCDSSRHHRLLFRTTIL